MLNVLRIRVTTGLALALGAGACASDGDAVVIGAPGGSMPGPSSAEASPGEALPDEPGTPLQAQTGDPATPDGSDAGAAQDPESPGAPSLYSVPPRDLELPDFWPEQVANVCHDVRQLCRGVECPTFSEALGEAPSPVRDYCVSEDGEPFITLRHFGLPSVIYVFQPGSGELVSRIFIDDVPVCEEPAPSRYMVTGRFIPDCVWVRETDVPCTDGAAPNLGSFENCQYPSP